MDPMDMETLGKFAKGYKRLTEETISARWYLANAIREAAANGMRQVDIVKATGYTREQIRRIVAGRTR